MIYPGKLHKTVIGAVLAIGLAMALASCGSDSEGSATASGALTKAEFVDQANTICKKKTAEKWRRLEVAAKANGGALGARPKEVEKVVVDVILPIYDEVFSEIESLPPPSNDQAQVEQILQEYRAALKDSEAKPLQLLHNNPFSSADSAADQYGMKECLHL